MANTIILKNGSGVPANGTLQKGEVAIDTVNKVLYSSTNGTDIFTIEGGGGMVYATPSNNTKIESLDEITGVAGGCTCSYWGVNKSFQSLVGGKVRVTFDIKSSDTTVSHYIDIFNATGESQPVWFNASSDNSEYFGIQPPIHITNPLSGKSNNTYYTFSYELDITSGGYTCISFFLSGTDNNKTNGIKNLRVKYDITTTAPSSTGVRLASVSWNK